MKNHQVSIKNEVFELPVAIVVNKEGRRDEFLILPKNYSTKEKTIRGPRKRTKPSKYDSLRKNSELWGLFEWVGFTPYFATMEGYSEQLS